MIPLWSGVVYHPGWRHTESFKESMDSLPTRFEGSIDTPFAFLMLF